MSPQDIIKWRSAVKLFISYMDATNAIARSDASCAKTIKKCFKGVDFMWVAGWRLDIKASFTGELPICFRSMSVNCEG